MLKKISTDKAPRAIGPYSQAVVSGGFVFLSGQIALEPSSGEVVKGDIAVQTRQVINNITAVLEAAGCTANDVVKTTVYLKDIRDFGDMNLVYEEFFKNRPARSTVEVSNLPKGVMVEIECIAAIP
jgi:2-iminobutanoate/2-iminopropanoate deaminase